MLKTENPAAGANGGRGSHVVSLPAERCEPITQHPGPSMAIVMGQALRRGLLNLPCAEHGEALRWVAGQALAGFADERGLEAAASLAFAMGHALALAAGAARC